MLLKREIGPESGAVEAVVGAVFKHRGGASLGMGRGFKSAANRLEFRFERKLQNRPRSSRDPPRSTTIERRSYSRFFENAAQQSWNRFHNTWSVIAPRSRRDRGVLPRFVVAVRSAIIVMKIWRSRASTRLHWRPLDRDRAILS